MLVRRPRPVIAVAAAAVGAVLLLLLVLTTGGGSPLGGSVRAPDVLIPAPPPVLPVAVAGRPPDRTGLLSALAAGLRNRALGPGARAVVVDAVTGSALLSAGGTGTVPPASTAKIVTAVAALERLGGDARLETRVVAGSQPDSVVLVGGGDVTLAGPAARPAYPPSARLADLASATASRLTSAGLRRVRLAVDASLFSGPALAPGWVAGYVTQGDVAPVSALAVDGGRVRAGSRVRDAHPAAAAGRLFARLLGAAGVTVVGPVTPAGAAPKAAPLAMVRSAPVAVLVERMLTTSDNDLAEALARLVAVRSGLPGSFAGGVEAVRRTVSALGVDPTGLRLYDASGLSRSDRLEPQILTSLLSLATSPQHPELRPVLTGLPVAGLTGTLTERYAARPVAAAAGVVRAKTGTLSGVSSLAGVALDADGRLLVFAFVAPAAPVRRPAERALDGLAAVLAACGCR